jgi:hypothetical protein
MKYLALLIASAFFLSASTYGDVRTAKIYGIGKTGEAPLFIQKIETKLLGSGVTHESATITDSSGRVVLTEESEYRGDQLIHQMMRKFQTQEAYEVEVNSGKVTFHSFHLKDDKLVPSDPDKSEEVKEDFITGPVMIPFLQEHWHEVARGDTVAVRLGVLEIAESVGFKFWQDGNLEISGRSWIHIRMKPSSIFIALVAGTVELGLDPVQKKLMYYKGRTPLKVNSNGKWSPLDAEIIYDP